MIIGSWGASRPPRLASPASRRCHMFHVYRNDYISNASRVIRFRVDIHVHGRAANPGFPFDSPVAVPPRFPCGDVRGGGKGSPNIVSESRYREWYGSVGPHGGIFGHGPSMHRYTCSGHICSYSTTHTTKISTNTLLGCPHPAPPRWCTGALRAIAKPPARACPPPDSRHIRGANAAGSQRNRSATDQRSRPSRCKTDVPRGDMARH